MEPRDPLDTIPLSERTLGGLLAVRSRARPAHPVVEVSGTRLTWSDLAERSAHLAYGLADIGVRKGDVVCQLSGNTAAHVVAMFAIARLGAIECPVNTGLRGAVLRHVLTHSGAAVVLAEPEQLDRLAPEMTGRGGPNTLIVTGDHGGVTVPGVTVIVEAEMRGGRFSDAEVLPGDPATLMYTSGSTGPAKGVLHAHHFAFATAAVKASMWGLTSNDVLFSALPLFHANARYSTLLTACVLDARAVIVARFSASRFWAQVGAAQATEVGTVGAVAPILLAHPEHPDERRHHVRMMHGAGTLSPAQRQEFERRFRVRLVNGFSMTETSHVATSSPDDPNRYRGAGKPAPGFEVVILDDDDRAVPPGVVGQIAVRPGRPYSMFLGYHRDPEATLAASRNLWFHTGDVGFLDSDGYLHWVDRRHDVIRRRGEMISSRDVEQAALSYPHVAEAAAVGVPAELGEEEVFLLVRVNPGSDVDLGDLEGHCRAALPDFAVPRFYKVVDDFPYTDTHKIAKHVLKSMGLVPDRDTATPRTDPS
jgi:crotonobetaine/carnitine-CoA ligase